MKKVIITIMTIIMLLGHTSTAYAAEQQDIEESSYQTQSEITKTIAVMYTNDEIKLLSSLVQAEAGNQPYKGKVGVANVVLNRVKSSRYPDTIKEVIYQSGQFSVVRNGSLNRMLSNYNNNEQSKDCIKAAKDALEGENFVGNYTGFRVYSSSFAKSVGDYIVIGDHIFH